MGNQVQSSHKPQSSQDVPGKVNNLLDMNNSNPSNLYNSSKTLVINSNDPNHSALLEQQQKSMIKYIKYTDLVNSFRHYSINKQYLNLERFNDCISSLLRFDIPLICYTYLSERLFNLIDKVI